MSNSLVHFLTVNEGLQMDLWTEWLWGFCIVERES